MEILNLVPIKKELKEMIDEEVLDRNGEIDFEEFVTLMNRKSIETDSEEVIFNTFRIFVIELNILLFITDMTHIMVNILVLV